MNELLEEPLFFDPIFHEKIWGGISLKTRLNKAIPQGKPIGESWELSAIPLYPSIVSSGTQRGKTLEQLQREYGARLTGKSGISFPLLAKYIDATETLSVQVHPDDKSAHDNKWDICGKTECWYIVDALENAQLVTGFNRDVTRESILNALENGTFEKLLNRVSVKPGEIYFIPAGTVHAILGKSLIYEVQQLSDKTFRFYDWNRLDSSNKHRQLHINEALMVVDMKRQLSYKVTPVEFEYREYTHAYRIACRYFAIEEYRFKEQATIRLIQRDSLRVLSVIKGSLKICTTSSSIHVDMGMSVLIPFVMQDVSIIGDTNTHVLVTFIPDLKKDIIEPLIAQKIPVDNIVALAGNHRFNDLKANYN